MGVPEFLLSASEEGLKNVLMGSGNIRINICDTFVWVSSLLDGHKQYHVWWTGQMLTDYGEWIENVGHKYNSLIIATIKEESNEHPQYIDFRILTELHTRKRKVIIYDIWNPKSQPFQITILHTFSSF